MKKSELVEEYKGLYSRLEEILYHTDPLGLNFGDNPDEYSSEVNTILPRLHHARSEKDVLSIVHEEFVRRFDSDTAGPISNPKYSEAAKEIWNAWINSRRELTWQAHQVRTLRVPDSQRRSDVARGLCAALEPTKCVEQYEKRLRP